MLVGAEIIGTVLEVIVLIIVAGFVMVGGIGALLSRSRGGSLTGGFLRSVVLPPWPLGWAWVWWSTRSSRRGMEFAYDLPDEEVGASSPSNTLPAPAEKPLGPPWGRRF